MNWNQVLNFKISSIYLSDFWAARQRRPTEISSAFGQD
jgi:hypothetical protein